MVLLLSPEQIKLECCACAQNKALEEGNWWLYPDDAGDSSERGRNTANLISDGEGLFCPFSQIGAIVLLILLLSPERIELETCACTQIEALREGKWCWYLDDIGDPSERGRSAANLISDGGGLFCPFFSNWCHGSAQKPLQELFKWGWFLVHTHAFWETVSDKPNNSAVPWIACVCVS